MGEEISINEEFPWSGTFNCNNENWLGRRRQFGKKEKRKKLGYSLILFSSFSFSS